MRELHCIIALLGRTFRQRNRITGTAWDQQGTEFLN